MTPPRRFDEHYQEHAVLADGTRVVLRLLRPDDKRLLAHGFEQLSPRSRYRRFLAGKQRLTERDLRYLTEVDGDHHFALGAVATNPQGHEEGLGIARFVRSADRPHVAEPAVVVIDSHQNRGLGRLLCRRLVEAALERGVTDFRCEVLASNGPMRGLIQELSPNADVQMNGDAATIEFPLSAPAPQPTGADRLSPSMIDHLLGLAGRGIMITLHRALARWSGRAE